LGPIGPVERTVHHAPPLWEVVGRDPEATALEDAANRQSWRTLDELSGAVVHLLESEGMAPGDHLVLSGTNRVEYLDVIIGALRGGFVFTPVKTGWTANEVGYVLDDAGSRLVATDLQGPAEAARQRKLPVLRLDRLVERLACHTGRPVPYHRAGSKLTYTSGTTGRPKGVQRIGVTPVPFTESFAELSKIGTHALLQIPPDGTHLVASRLCHGAPLTFALGALAAGAPLRLLDRWEPLHALEELDRDVASTVVVPTMLRQWLGLPDDIRSAHPLRSLRRVVHGGEPCPVELKRRALEWLGPILIEYYGSSEGGMTVVTTEEWLERPGTVGRSITGADDDIRILGPGGEQLGPGEEGRVFFWARVDFEYKGDPQKTADAHYLDMFTSGDIGWVDADGYLFLSGRSSDVIISAGVNIYPAEVEDLLGEIPGIAELCVVGAPDEERGETVAAFVVPSPGVTGEDAVAAVCRAAEECIAGYKRPRLIYVRDNPLPRDETGKLLRAALRKQLWDDSNGFAATEH
jgi:long-chain acyl-CoA synthetase